MAHLASLRIVGANGQPFPGDSLKDTNKKLDLNEILCCTYTAQRAGDAAQGRHASGMKVIPVLVQKHLGACTPRVLEAMRIGEKLKKVTIYFYRTQKDAGLDEAYYKITLENAFITKHRIFTGLPAQEGSQVTAKPISDYDSQECEEIEFAYSKVTSEYVQGTHKDGPGNQQAAWDWTQTQVAGP